MALTILCGNKHFRDVQAILFDKDGTLADSFDFLRALAQKRAQLVDARVPGVGEPLLMAFGVSEGQLDPSGLMAVGSRHDNEIAAAAYVAETGCSWPAALAIAREAFSEADNYLQRGADTCPLFPGSREVLIQLAQAGCKLGILSADSPANVQAFATRYDLVPYLQVLQGTDALVPPKPEPALFERACASLGLPPRAALMVGDSALDFEMARRAGAAGAIGIAWGNAQAPALQAADVAIADLREIAIAP